MAAIPGGTRRTLRVLAESGAVALAVVEIVRERMEPAIGLGGLPVARIRHVIAGAVMGCGGIGHRA
jgi:hypothetical protein